MKLPHSPLSRIEPHRVTSGVERATSAAERVEAGERRGLARRAGVVSAAVFSSRILGVIREQVFATCFGAGRELDAFVTAFRIPNLFRDLFAEGALSAAFVATFAQEESKRGQEAAWRLANLVVNALALIVGTVCLAGIVWAPAIVSAIAPGFDEIAGKTELTVRMTRVMFPFLLLIALAAVAMGILNTKNRFGIPPRRRRSSTWARSSAASVSRGGSRPTTSRRSAGPPSPPTRRASSTRSWAWRSVRSSGASASCSCRSRRCIGSAIATARSSRSATLACARCCASWDPRRSARRRSR
jgi:hypothetical protein